MLVLVVNAGSSSLKYQLVDTESAIVWASGLVERIGETVTRPTQEVAFMVSGKLNLEIGGARFTVGPGDSFRIRGEPHRWENPYDEPAVAIWVIAPPVY